ncbi:hypothetical protein R1sor_005797 [Riccia sorocarpa]|uniref:Reverse transcriptase domain-containing protein n=1 Tax=Riccia sorocarpa TaxID=122646 RepID=A0ABD3HMM9_9MARC
MDVDVLRNDTVMKEVKDAWTNHPAGVSDPQVKWSLGWSRIRTVLKAHKAAGRRPVERSDTLKTELAALRMRIQFDTQIDLRERVLNLEKKIRERELKDAKSWRMRSRIRWMEAREAPSHYFFTQLKAKHARETMKLLCKGSGANTSDEDEMKAEITSYFQEQFDCQEATQQELNKRQEVLRLMDRRAIETQNEALTRVLRGSSKVHINGWFVENIQLNRGVRQGYPVAPYLFVLSTQPLMLLLEKAQREGYIEGIKLPCGKQLIHQLFADNTCIHFQAIENFFNKTKELVGAFEIISGAALNIDKSVIIPLGVQEPQEWIRNTGCKIARKGEIVIYLGGPTGAELKDDQIGEFVMNNLRNHLFYWSHKLLTWARKVIILKHILGMVPIYQLMTLSLTRKEFTELEKVNRLFLWGLNSNGRQKKSLVGWDVITKPKVKGGLGIGCFQLQAERCKLITVMETWTGYKTLAEGPLATSSGWEWRGNNVRLKGWLAPNAIWKQLLAQNPTSDNPLYAKWPGSGLDLEWTTRWKALWRGCHSERNKIWIWRIYYFFTGSRAAKMNVSDRICHKCGSEEESVPHLFWDCKKARDR